MGDSKITNENKLLNVFRNYTSWQDDIKSVNEDYFNYNSKFQQIQNTIKTKQEEKDKIDLSSANSIYLKTRDVLRHIETIFIETKEKSLTNSSTNLKLSQTNT